MSEKTPTADLLVAAKWVCDCWGAPDDRYVRADMEAAIASLRKAITKAKDTTPAAPMNRADEYAETERRR